MNQSFEVECSPDLETWDTAVTVTNTTGTLVFEDPNATAHDCRYYRVVGQCPSRLVLASCSVR